LTGIGAVVDAAARRFEAAGIAGARGEAELLLAQLLDVDRGQLFVRRLEPLDAETAARYEAWVARREEREPFQHITGVQEFYGVEFRVDPRVLIPRPETEGIVDAALGLDLPHEATVADVGTGSGCLAVVLALKRPAWRVLALDRSKRALAAAAGNVERHGVADRVELVHGRLEAPPERWVGRIDLLVSNPPYVTEAEWAGLQPEVRDHDPREALVAGPTGLEAYAALIPVARRLLRPAGRIVLELGFGQAEAVRRIALDAGFTNVELRDDLRSIPRILEGASPGPGPSAPRG
jgi:release factor glutamine methyltransferase